MGGAQRYPSTPPVRRWVSLRSTHPTIFECGITISRRDAPEVLHFVVPLENRGRREDRVRAAPAVLRAIDATKICTQAYRFGGGIRPSLRNGFTAYFVLTPANGLCCHRHPQEALAPHELDASVAASGPHDFTVRVCRARQSQPSRPPLPAPRLRRWPTPLWRDRMAGVVNLICPTALAEYFCVKGWTDFW
ncbi:hypothetical protein SAMN05444171_5437 [Bradyrhizobium lablabi]|jgi:hypothetical protein|uniref:Uncharacterized protein n=2 Tax=Bradyrhizobium TaxID=374 RepID=A0ABY0PBY4_9BRAD|nr:hypothetical protein SAMN05444163_1732 [Bradyrhizobium ottawaense]SED86301.1 hypothetical protein SAMN05444171_5437 [Bradyrhizobium lablabi]SHL82318.1 hypothetical protein SAMN05444321_4223 [Bradyrhizobium lablabi]